MTGGGGSPGEHHCGLRATESGHWWTLAAVVAAAAAAVPHRRPPTGAAEHLSVRRRSGAGWG